jgi:ribosomal protein S18 acetylase RimI-like enzyme
LTPKFQLRPAETDDYDFLYQLHVASMKPSVEATWGWDEVWQSDYFRQHFDPSRRQIVQTEGQDVGVISVEHRSDEYYLALIEILPAYQGRGLGSALIRDFIRAAQECSLPAALHVLKANPAARRLYQRLGFVIIAEEEVKYKMIYAQR